LLAHAVLLIPVVLAGLALLSWEDLSFRALARGRVETRDGDAHASLGVQAVPPTATERR
jgi:hypothetical protein